LIEELISIAKGGELWIFVSSSSSSTSVAFDGVASASLPLDTRLDLGKGDELPLAFVEVEQGTTTVRVPDRMVTEGMVTEGMVRKERSRAGMVTVGMVTEGMVYCFNGLRKNGHKKLTQVKEDISISISVSSLIINKPL
jgi:hypothetical protein